MRRRVIGINVADVQDAIQTAVGGGTVSQVLRGEARYDLVVRYQPALRAWLSCVLLPMTVFPTSDALACVRPVTHGRGRPRARP